MINTELSPHSLMIQLLFCTDIPPLHNTKHIPPLLTENLFLQILQYAENWPFLHSEAMNDLPPIGSCTLSAF